MSSESLLQKRAERRSGYRWVQLLLASVYSGAFHPTAEGQAAIADAVVEKARAVLAKYEQPSQALPAETGGPGSRRVASPTTADERATAHVPPQVSAARGCTPTGAPLDAHESCPHGESG